jgi:CRP-like cAMP-binding protein
VKQPFNVETFLATVNGGRSISKYRKNQTVFLQGELADSVFFIEEGKVKVSVVSERERKRSSQSMARGISSARAV